MILVRPHSGGPRLRTACNWNRSHQLDEHNPRSYEATLQVPEYLLKAFPYSPCDYCLRTSASCKHQNITLRRKTRWKAARDKALGYPISVKKRPHKTGEVFSSISCRAILFRVIGRTRAITRDIPWKLELVTAVVLNNHHPLSPHPHPCPLYPLITGEGMGDDEDRTLCGHRWSEGTCWKFVGRAAAHQHGGLRRRRW